VRLSNVLDDGEAEASAAGRAASGGVHPVEPVEDARQMLRRNADAVVGHIQARGVPSHLGHGNGHVSARWRVADRILDQIREQLT
jgi:hypothetical protein